MSEPVSTAQYFPWDGGAVFVGTAGVFNFTPADHNGLAIDAFEMLTVKDGKFVVLGR